MYNIYICTCVIARRMEGTTRMMRLLLLQDPPQAFRWYGWNVGRTGQSLWRAGMFTGKPQYVIPSSPFLHRSRCSTLTGVKTARYSSRAYIYIHRIYWDLYIYWACECQMFYVSYYCRKVRLLVQSNYQQFLTYLLNKIRATLNQKE